MKRGELYYYPKDKWPAGLKKGFYFFNEMAGLYAILIPVEWGLNCCVKDVGGPLIKRDELHELLPASSSKGYQTELTF